MKLPNYHFELAVRVAVLVGLTAYSSLIASNLITESGSTFFGEKGVHVIRIVLPSTNYEALRCNPRHYVSGEINVDGKKIMRIGVRLKGSQSFEPIDAKPSFTLDFAKFQDESLDGVSKIHLNNSVEDPTLSNEKLGGEIFQLAGIPAARVTRASVFLNGRRLGLYVVTEGFCAGFLSDRNLPSETEIYELGPGKDLRDIGPLQRPKDLQLDGRSKNNGFAEAFDPKMVDEEECLKLAAIEVMLCHRDGYATAKNNFRILAERKPGHLIILPHGMDQLFNIPKFPWKPQFGGDVVRILTATAEGESRYKNCFSNILANTSARELTNRFGQLVEELGPVATDQELSLARREGAAESLRIASRISFLNRELRYSGPSDPATNDLTQGWTFGANAEAKAIDAARKGDSKIELSLPVDGCYNYLKRQIHLAPGTYVLEGCCKVADVQPLRYGRSKGAGLRIEGDAPNNGLIGSSGWQRIQTKFTVTDRPATTLLCELRAEAGRAWFDLKTLQLKKLSD